MIRKIGAALAIAAGALSAIGVAAPAFAAPGPGNGTIDPNEFVVWRDTGFTGPFYDFANPTASYPNEDTTTVKFLGTTTKVNDNGSSIANYDIGNYVQAYENFSYGGLFIQLLPYGQTSGSLSYAYSSLGTFDNKISSNRVQGP